MHQISRVNVSKFTTMKVGSEAEYAFFPENTEELVSIIYDLRSKKIPWSIMGAGSNTLVSSYGIEGAVICTTGIDHVKISTDGTIVAGGGVRLPKLANIAAQAQLSGCEFYEGIPGTVGGAVIMNAGAHKHWTSEIIDRVSLFDVNSLKILNLVPSQIEFGYRHSNINPKRYIVLEAKFRLNTNRTTSQIQNTMKQYAAERLINQPKGYSSGCIFRNPSCGKLFAGKLIDEMGLKGLKMGGAEISNVHGNFIVNMKSASSQNICDLMHYTQIKAWKVYKTWLKPEVQPLGKFDDTDQLLWLPIDYRPTDWEQQIEHHIVQRFGN